MSLGTGLYSTGGGFSTFGSSFGFDSYDLFTPTATALTTAKTEAAKNDTNWQNVLDAILKYGGGILTVLTTSGVIKNKNLTTVTSADYDKNALAALLEANGGSINKDPNVITIPQRASGFSIDFSNPVILAAIVAVVYLIFKK